MIGSISLSELKNNYQAEFFDRLRSVHSPKVIYWEQILIPRVSLIAGHSLLKENGVSNSFLLESNENSCSPPDCKSVIFIISSKVTTVDCVQAFITRDLKFTKSSPPKEYHIIAIPSFTYACKHFLEEKGVTKHILSVFEFPLTILPVEYDVLSMEDPDCFANYAIAQKQQGIYSFVQGLLRFQKVFGLFPKICAKGDKAKEVARMLLRLRHETVDSPESKDFNGTPVDEVECRTDMLVILDRSTDCLTPLLSQLTYEGLINEKWGIHYGVCRFLTDIPSCQALPKRMTLNATDELFAELRDQNFSVVGPSLHRRSKEISALVNESKAAKDVPELKRVVDQLPELRTKRSALETHTIIAENLQKHISVDDFMLSLSAQQDFLRGMETDRAHLYIEECLLRAAPLEEVLRLICIQSFCNGGLKARLLDHYKREIFQTYGFEHVFTLDNLDRVGLLHDGTNPVTRSSVETRSKNAAVRQTVTTTSSMFGTSLKRNLRLLINPQQHSNEAAMLLETDHTLANLYAGYIPISVRLVQALSMGWLPKTLSANAGQLINTSSSSVLSMTTSALTTGKSLVSGLISDDTGSLLQSNRIRRSPRSSVSSLPNDGANFIVNLTPGVLFEEVQTSQSANTYSDLIPSSSDSQRKSKVIVVAFVGGVTHAEVSALRCLASSDDSTTEFIILTTGFLNTHTFLRSLSQEIHPAALLPF